MIVNRGRVVPGDDGMAQRPLPQARWAAHAALLLAAAVATIIISRYSGEAPNLGFGIGIAALLLIASSMAAGSMLHVLRSGYVIVGYASFVLAALCMLFAQLTTSGPVHITCAAAGTVFGLVACGSFLLQIRRSKARN